jgi:hypothetical protein
MYHFTNPKAMLHLNLREELDATRGASVLETAQTENVELTAALLKELGIDSYEMGRKRLEKRKMLLQTAYSEEQIRNICIKYRLRCLPESLFKGHVDELVPQKKREFEQDFTEGMQEEVAQEEYRILAPGEMFRLTIADKDPLLLYRFESKGAYYYKLVHQWGGDLSKWRAAIHYPLRSVKHLIGCCMLFWLVLLMAVTANIGISATSTLTLTSMLLMALTIFSVSMFRTDNGNYHTSDRIWDSEEEF